MCVNETTNAKGVGMGVLSQLFWAVDFARLTMDWMEMPPFGGSGGVKMCFVEGRFTTSPGETNEVFSA